MHKNKVLNIHKKMRKNCKYEREALPIRVSAHFPKKRKYDNDGQNLMDYSLANDLIDSQYSVKFPI